MKENQKEFIHNLFLVFIVISASVLAALPSLSDAFKNTSDNLIYHQMQRLEAETLIYYIENGSYYRICSSNILQTANIDTVYASGAAISCQSNDSNSEFAMFTKISENTYFCIDSHETGVRTTYGDPHKFRC